MGKYIVERKNTRLDGKSLPVGSVVELTDQQAKNLVNKVRKYEAPKVVETSEPPAPPTPPAPRDVTGGKPPQAKQAKK